MANTDTKKFYLKQNIIFILENGFYLARVDKQIDDITGFGVDTWLFKKYGTGNIELPVNGNYMFKVDLANNDTFIKRINELVKGAE